MVLFPRKKRYSKISYEKRVLLIELVEKQQLTISRAAKKLHIKVPTAKVILSNYHKKGRIFNKKCIPKEPKPESEESPKEQSPAASEAPLPLPQNFSIQFVPFALAPQLSYFMMPSFPYH